MELDQIVVVTGASGCLAQHLVKLLVAKDDNIKEIRCLDLVEPNKSTQMKHLELKQQQSDENKQITNEKIIISWTIGDIRDINVVEKIVNGATSIIHCAAIIDLNRHQDEQLLESTNIRGTENLLKAAVKFAVPSFIHVSSIEACMSSEAIYYATEHTTPKVNKFLFGASSRTKFEAEQIVRHYSNTKLSTNYNQPRDSTATNQCKYASLNAVIVRLPPIYGEYDKHFVSQILKIAKIFGGKLRKLDHVWIRQQPIYAGNAAWACFKARQKTFRDQSISGEEFYITDDTPICDPYDFLVPYLKCRKFTLLEPTYPYLLVWMLLVLYFFIKDFIKATDVFGLFDGKRYEAKKGENISSWDEYVTPEKATFICNTYFFNRTKASLRLDYEPIYDADTSRKLSTEWYEKELKL